MTVREVRDHTRHGIEHAAPLPLSLRGASSTLRELFGVVNFILLVRNLLRGGAHRVVLDNLGCVFILGGVVPPFAVGGKAWGEYVSGGSPDPALQHLALQAFDAQLAHGFSLQAVWVPRDLNVRADFLSHAAEYPDHGYSLHQALFQLLDEEWGPHTVDRFATASNRLLPRFCSRFFHPEAMWTDALSVAWSGEVNWVFPPVDLAAPAITHLRRCQASGTVIFHSIPGSPALRLLQPGGREWAPDIIGVFRLGAARDCLRGAHPFRSLHSRGELISVHINGRDP